MARLKHGPDSARIWWLKTGAEAARQAPLKPRGGRHSSRTTARLVRRLTRLDRIRYLRRSGSVVVE